MRETRWCQECCMRVWSDRKSTRLNSSHGYISYAVFCLKKKKKSNTLLNKQIQRNNSATFPPVLAGHIHATHITLMSPRRVMACHRPLFTVVFTITVMTT